MYKHERITLVILAYVIGFSTAFIGFNFVNPGYVSHHDNPSGNQHYKNHEEVVKEIKDESGGKVDVEVKSDGLYALIGSNSRILSAQAISATSAVDGFHYEVFNSSVSPSGDYITYCAQLLEGDLDCKHYIYDLATDSTHVLSLPNGEQVTSPLGEIFAEWLPNDVLTTDGYMSELGKKPWNLIAKP